LVVVNVLTSAAKLSRLKIEYYKNHFAAYNLDHIIQVDARNDKTINTTLQEFLQSYGQSYNHLLAQTKISTINKFYKEKEPINLRICQVYYNNAKKVLFYADEQMSFLRNNARYSYISSNKGHFNTCRCITGSSNSPTSICKVFGCCFLADNGRTDDISVMSLDKFVYSESNNENTLLNTNVFAIESKNQHCYCCLCHRM
jgi:hypothetical protein